jgi:toluene monooxygenase system protein E
MTPQPRRTYWHLEGRGRVPSEYEIVSTQLLPSATKGFAVRTGVAAWIERHRHTGGLVCADWDAFADPQATTYASYVEVQNERTIHVQSVFASLGDQRSPDAWLRCVREILAPLRYPAHGLQMVSAYLGSMAPSGRLAIALSFQTADAIRVVQHLAERLALFRRQHPNIADDARAHWESEPAWQPWRKLIEELLVTYGFEEALIGLNLVVKPAFDAFFLHHLAQTAATLGDFATQQMLGSLAQNAAWQRAFTRSLVDLLALSDAGNLARIAELVGRTLPAARAAVEVSAERLAALSGCAVGTPALHALHEEYLAQLGVGSQAMHEDPR